MTRVTRRRFVESAGLLAGAAALLQTGGRLHAAPPEADMAFRSAIELAAAIRNGTVSSLELTEFFISRIERYDGQLNAVVVRDFDNARAAALAADAAQAKGRVLGPLHGLPMTIKESYDIAGLPTTWGFPSAADNVASADAVVVERFKQAGAHFLGKTNVPISLGDFQSYNSIYGTTNNPWNLDRTPGGSSGGSAVALAAGLTGLDSGSDIGGSIRNPAHYCGVYGHKPTWSVVPSRGHTPPGLPALPQDPDLAVVGPLARSAEDLALALRIVSGPDILTANGWQLALPKPRRTSLRGMKVALWADDPVAPVDAEISERIGQVGAELSRRGATVVDTARPEFAAPEYSETYLGLLLAVTGGPEFKMDHGDWLALNGRRGGYRVAWQRFFADWDILLCPISATAAFPHDHSDIDERTLEVNDEPRPYFEQVFWASLATLSYLPGTVFPAGLSSDGLPIGLQAIGAAFDDYQTIEFARLITRELGGFQPPPGFG